MTSDPADVRQQGFTDVSAVRAILAALEEKNPLPDLIRFRGLSVVDAARLLQALPGWQRDERQGTSPTFGEFVALGERFPSVVLDGYRATSGRDDERITIEGLRCSGLTWDEARALREWSDGADELDVEPENGTWRVTAWWD